MDPWLLLILFLTLRIQVVRSACPRKKEQQEWISVTLHKLLIAPKTLSVTSFKYNPNSRKSDWVDANLGPHSIFFTTANEQFTEISGVLTTAKQRHDARQIMNESLRMPADALLPACSIELLAFAPLKKGTSCPFCMDWRGSRPSVGTGSLELAGQRWPCYYRAQYENWRKVNYVPNRTFWPVLVYCPSPDYQSSCSSIDKYFRKNKSNKLHDASLSLHLSSLNPNKLHTALTASFQLVVNRWTAEVKEKQRMAICVPIPYLMEEQQLASGQLIRDFVRYYSKLGIKVFMYDSFGKASKYIFGTADTLFGNSKSSYSESAQTVGDKLKVDPRGGIVGWQQEQQLGEQLNLVYHDYTIMGLLDPTMESFKSIFGHSEWQTTTDSDKVLTLTHCRFEAQEIFGIDRVFVADFDEFFFCPNAKSNMELLSQIINEKADEYERKGNDQILYKQVWVANKTEVVFDCVNEQLRNKRSMYDCFAPTQFPVSNHGVKPLHIGHRCPLTSYHEACDEDRRYNCACESLTTAPCAFIHFSLRNKKYAWRWWRQKHNAHLFVDKSIEIKDMLLQDGVLSIPRTLLTSAREYDVNIAPA